jgi:hypothetical protein
MVIMMKIFSNHFKRFVFLSTFLLVSSQVKVLSQPSFKPEETPKLPICDYSVIQGAQNELNKLIYDYKLKSENENVWGTKIRLQEGTLVYDAVKYYKCDLKYQLQKPTQSFGRY